MEYLTAGVNPDRFISPQARSFLILTSLRNLRLYVTRCSDTESFVIRFEYFSRGVFDHLEPLVTTTLPERTALATLDEEQAVEAVVATAFPALGDVLLAHRAVAVHPARLFIVTPVEKTIIRTTTYKGQKIPDQSKCSKYYYTVKVA